MATDNNYRGQSYSDKEIAKTVPFIDFAGMTPEDFQYDNKGMIVGVSPKFSAGTSTKDLTSNADKATYAMLTGQGAGTGAGASSAVKKGKKTINDAYATLIAFLSKQQNPWANMKAQNTATDPQLQQLLQTQGVDTTPTQQFASMLNTQGQGQADAFQNLINIMGGTYEEGRTANKANAKYDQAVALANLLKAFGG